MVGTYADNEQQRDQRDEQTTQQVTTTDRATLDQQIAALVDIVRANQYRIDRLEARTKRAKVELRKLLERRGENWSDEEGYAHLVAEGERAAYDTGALDDLLVDDPLRYGWLKDYRRKSKVSGGVRVK